MVDPQWPELTLSDPFLTPNVVILGHFRPFVCATPTQGNLNRQEYPKYAEKQLFLGTF